MKCARSVAKFVFCRVPRRITFCLLSRPLETRIVIWGGTASVGRGADVTYNFSRETGATAGAVILN